MESSKFKVQSWKVRQKYNKLDAHAAFRSAQRLGTLPAPLHCVPPIDLIKRTRLFALSVLAFCRKLRKRTRHTRPSCNSANPRILFDPIIEPSGRVAREPNSSPSYTLPSRRLMSVLTGWSTFVTETFTKSLRSCKKRRNLPPYSLLPTRPRGRIVLE